MTFQPLERDDSDFVASDISAASSASAAFGNIKASLYSILTFPAFSISTFPCAMRRASSEISHPVTSEFGMVNPKVMAMQPDPVQISRICFLSSASRDETSSSIHWQSSVVSDSCKKRQRHIHQDRL